MSYLRVLVLCLVVAFGAPTTAAAGADDPVAARPTQERTPEPPEGFADTVVADVAAPTALTWTPDGRMVIASKPGRVVVRHDDGTTSTALDISGRVCDDFERGLVGVAVDPDFERNRFLYLYYTHEVRGSCGTNGPDPANRVSRFVLGDDDAVVPGSEKVLVDHILSPQGHHIAGDLEFGADGFLYISVGDGVCSLGRETHCGPTNDNSQKLNRPQGKILRVTRAGLPPASNPYVDEPGARRCTRPGTVRSGTGPCKEIFASGFRNPFRFARKPGTSRFYVNDVGLGTWEEVDLLRKGRNYGWNEREGHCRRDSTTACGRVAGFTNPIHDYRHGECRSITGGAFVPAGLWPRFRGSYLYSDFACGKIFLLQRRADGGFRRSTFLSGAKGPVHLRFGPYGDTTALYYLSYFTNTVHRISRSVANTPPVADFTYRPDGLHVSFSGAPSHDDDPGDRITSWTWDFGDGTTAVTTTPTTTHTYPAAEPVQVTLKVTDAEGASDETSRLVHPGEHPPTLAITAPDPQATFGVDARVDLTAEASDAEDGALPGSAITWTLRLQHANHFHPYLGPVTGSSVTTRYPAPENLAAARTSRLVVIATAVDSRGLTTTVRRTLRPRVVDLTFRTAPGGGSVVVQGKRRPTPFTARSWVGYVFAVRAPDQVIDGVRSVFVRWSDDGARAHDITTPAKSRTYTARFR